MGNRRSFKVPFFATVSVAGILMLIILLMYFFLRTSWKTVNGRRSEELVLLPHEIKYTDIVQATHKFSQGNLLGHGGFRILPKDNSAVAVKRVSENSNQGEREFLAEVKIISSLSHRNLIKLRGWCRKNNELILVYEFMQRGSAAVEHPV